MVSLNQTLQSFQHAVIYKKIKPLEGVEGLVELSQSNCFLLGRIGPAEVFFYYCITIWVQYIKKTPKKKKNKQNLQTKQNLHLLIMLFLIQIAGIYSCRTY